MHIIGMNVWIWGPPLWEILHAASFLCDRKKYSAKKFFNSLISILPCIYCRQSYETFLKDDPPPSNHFAEWCFNLHSKVNEKLIGQRLEKLKIEMPFTVVQIDAMRKTLFAEPEFAVIQKRFLIESDELFLWRSISIVLLAFFISEGPQEGRDIFIKELMNIIQLSDQANSSIINETLQKLVGLSPSAGRKILDSIKYGSTSDSPSQLIRAGACINKTCK
jgi:hypothetical protein